MEKNYHFLDIEINKPIYRKLPAMQYDNNSRYILVSVFSNFIPYDLTYATVKIYGIKGDKTVFFNNAKILDAKAGKFEIDLTEQCLAAAGDVEIQILILGANQERLSSNSFLVNVKKTIVDPIGITSQSEWGALTEGLANLAEYDIYKQNINKHDTEIKNTTDRLNALYGKIREIFFEDIAGSSFKEKIVNITNRAKIEDSLFVISFRSYVTYEIDDSIEIDISYIGIKGNGCIFKCIGNIPTFINVISSKEPSRNKKYINKVQIATSNENFGTGIVFGGPNSKGLSDLVCNGITVLDGFNKGVTFIDNAYLISFSNCEFKSPVEMPSGHKNYGENINFNQCLFCNNRGTCVINNNSSGDFRFYMCSFDYSDRVAECYAGGIIIENSHIEFRLSGETHIHLYDFELFKCEGSSAYIFINNSKLLGNRNYATGEIGNINREYLFVVNGGDLNTNMRSIIKLTNCSIWGLKTRSGYLCGGDTNGKFIVKDTQANLNWETSPKTKDNNNLSIYEFNINTSKCSYKILKMDVDGTLRDVIEFTVTEQGAKAYLELIYSGNITFNLLFKQEQTTADAYTQYYYRNDYIANKPTKNCKGDGWISFSKENFYYPSNSMNPLIIEMNRTNHVVGQKFYVAIENFNLW